jgi:dienelactone hydrolase
MTGTTDFSYGHGGVTLTGQLARPSGSGPHPAVLVMHSALGLDDHMCRRASDLAALGYVALATDMYGIGRKSLSRAETGPLLGPLLDHPDLLRSRVVAGLDAVRALPDVDSSRVGAIGFCFGGQCVLELARSGADVRSVVSFHGLLKTAMPAPSGTLTAKVLVITGAKDPYAPAEDIAAFEDEMTAAGADWQMTVYGAGFHAFSVPNISESRIPGTAYDPVLDSLSWAQATAFLAAAWES